MYSISPVSLLTRMCVPRSSAGWGEVQVEPAVLVEQAERELVEVAAERPRRDRLLALVEAVVVGVDELGQPVLLRRVDLAVDHLDPHRLLEALGDQRRLDVARVIGLLDAAQAPDLAGLRRRVRAAVLIAPGEHEQVVAHPVEAGDLRLEAGWAQVHEVVSGVDVVQRQAVAGRVAAHALLVPGGGDPHDAGVGAERRVGDDAERARAGRPPAQPQLLLAARLEVLDAELVDALVQLDVAVLVLGAVEAVVVDDELIVDVELGAVVAAQAERVGAGVFDPQVGDRVRDEVVGVASEVGVALPVDRGSQDVDVRRLAGLDGADRIQRVPDLVDALGDAGLLGRQVVLRRRRCGQRRDRRERAQRPHQAGDHAPAPAPGSALAHSRTPTTVGATRTQHLSSS
jgi:hypothetical protein